MIIPLNKTNCISWTSLITLSTEVWRQAITEFYPFRRINIVKTHTHKCQYINKKDKYYKK